MGSISYLVIIDSKILEEKVLPSFREGVKNTFIEEQRIKFIDEHYKDERYYRPSFTNLDGVLENLHTNSIFANFEKGFSIFNGSLVSEHPRDIDINSDYWSHEDLVLFFEFVLTNNCFEESYTFGRQLSTLGSLSTIPFNVGNFLIHKLSNLDSFWCLNNEGVQGWLTDKELVLLKDKINTIGYYEEGLIDDENMEEIVVRLREYLNVALNSKKGVLWGQDLNFIPPY
jgi:hypothetical protein